MIKETSGQRNADGEVSLSFVRKKKANPVLPDLPVIMQRTDRYQNLSARRAMTVFISAVRRVIPRLIFV